MNFLLTIVTIRILQIYESIQRAVRRNPEFCLLASICSIFFLTLLQLHISYINQDLWIASMSSSGIQNKCLLILSGIFGAILTKICCTMILNMSQEYRQYHLLLSRHHFVSTNQQRTDEKYKKDCLDFVFARMVSDIQRIRNVELNHRSTISLEDLSRVHSEINEIILKFRSDAKKILSKSEEGISLKELFPINFSLIDRRYRNIHMCEENIKSMVGF